MRDRAIIEMEQKNGKRAGLLFVQFEYLKTRQEALEAVEKVASLRERVCFLLWPETKWATVDAVQSDLLKKADKEMEAAQTRNKIQIAPASSLPAGARG